MELKNSSKFRYKILALLLDNSFMAIYGQDLIKPEFFPTDAESDFVKACVTYYGKFKRSPTDIEDVIELIGEKGDITLVQTIFDGFKNWNLELAQDKIIQFAREQAVKLAILDSIDDVNKGNLRQPLVLVEQALRVGEGIVNVGLDLVGDVDSWLYEYWNDKVRTPWTHINRVLQGGLSASELGVLMAPTNVGKSMGLVDIGYAAASIGSRLNVLHISQEQSMESLARRYAARMTFNFMKRNDNIDSYKAKFLEAARKYMPGRVRIVGGSQRMTLHDVKGHIERAFSDGFNPGLIIDDYADKILPVKKRKDKRFELSDIYMELKAYADMFNVPIWTATQSNRASMTKEIITVADIAEDLGKAQIADVIITISQTKEEYDMNKCRLFLAKVRDGKKNYLFDAKFYGKSQAIITTGRARKKAVEV